MSRQFEYTTLAQRYTARFPVLTYVGTQVNFWLLANALLAVIIVLYTNIISQTFEIPVSANFGTAMSVAVFLGLLYGVVLGLTGYYFDRRFLRGLTLGKVLLFKAIMSIALLAIALALLRFLLFELLMPPTLNIAGVALNKKSWDSLFYLLLIYYFFMSLVIGFINQVNKKYGPGVLVPLLLGRYRKPKEEVRIFMFMDLKSSTSTAEKLGHITYSSFIRDCFTDINDVLYPFYAQVYQYVGDEIVVMWPEIDGLRQQACVKFFFAVKKRFQDRAVYYKTTYGILPVFKAGLHMGQVTVVEIGEIKKDIAYHGDTLNTTARIQSVCNEYNRDFLASDHLIRKIGAIESVKYEELGMVLLKGKTEKIGIVSIA
jgi:adenylate cyclase